MTAATHIERIRQALEAWNQQFSGWSVSSNGDELTVVWLRDDASKAEHGSGVAGYLAAANPEALTAILADHARLTEALAAARVQLSALATDVDNVATWLLDAGMASKKYAVVHKLREQALFVMKETTNG